MLVQVPMNAPLVQITRTWDTYRYSHQCERSLKLCKVLEQAGKSVDRGTISLVVGRQIVGSDSRTSAVSGGRSRSILIHRHFLEIRNVSSERGSCRRR